MQRNNKETSPSKRLITIILRAETIFCRKRRSDRQELSYWRVHWISYFNKNNQPRDRILYDAFRSSIFAVKGKWKEIRFFWSIANEFIDYLIWTDVSPIGLPANYHCHPRHLQTRDETTCSIDFFKRRWLNRNALSNISIVIERWKNSFRRRLRKRKKSSRFAIYRSSSISFEAGFFNRSTWQKRYHLCTEWWQWWRLLLMW